MQTPNLFSVWRIWVSVMFDKIHNIDISETEDIDLFCYMRTYFLLDVEVLYFDFDQKQWPWILCNCLHFTSKSYQLWLNFFRLLDVNYYINKEYEKRIWTLNNQVYSVNTNLHYVSFLIFLSLFMFRKFLMFAHLDWLKIL